MHQFYNIHTHKPATDEADTLSIVNILQQFDAELVFPACSMGLHPCFLDGFDLAFNLLEQAATNPNVLAIGECGLDKLSAFSIPLQRQVFIKHINLVNQLRKPLIIHCVRAFDEILNTLSQHPPEVPVIFHGFNKKNIIGKILERGYLASFGAAICSDGSPAELALRDIPAGNFFLETDDSDRKIEEIYVRAAQIRKTHVDAIILQIHENYKKAFLYE